jgi:hypothetical protein
MKFFVTGSLASARGPRLILTWTLLLLASFVAAHLAREILSDGLWPDDLAAALHSSEALDYADWSDSMAPGFAARLEEFHVDLFLFSMAALILSAILYQAQGPERLRRALIVALFALPLVYATFKLALFFFSAFAWPAFAASTLLHGAYAVALAWCLTFLYRARAGNPGERP